jgi:hypothetical protein
LLTVFESIGIFFSSGISFLSIYGAGLLDLLFDMYSPAVEDYPAAVTIQIVEGYLSV